MNSELAPEDQYTIILIDDHPMLRSGVKQLISLEPQLKVIGEASSGQQGIELAEKLDPDLILLDLNMPGMNGLETLDQLRTRTLSGRVVVFSVSNHEDDVISEALTPVLAASLRESRPSSERDVQQLTPRECDILKLIAQGLPNKMIARKLMITESTVKVHVKHLLKKMKLKSRVEAAVWVLQEKVF